MIKITTVALSLLFGCLILSAACRKLPAREQISYPESIFLKRTGNYNGKQFSYRVFVPSGVTPDTHAPVMLYLHGAGNRGSDNESQLNGLAEIFEQRKEDLDSIVVVPQCPDGRFWDAEMLGQALSGLDDTIKEFTVDLHRIYLSGFSLGGYGVWTLAAMNPQKFAAIVPMSGRVLPREAEMKKVSPEISEISRSNDPYLQFAKRLKDTPIWISHGSDDAVVSPTSSSKIFEALKNEGSTIVKFELAQGKGHEPIALHDPEMYAWLKEQRLR